MTIPWRPCPIAAALMQNADRLLAAPPEIMPADVLAVSRHAPVSRISARSFHSQADRGATQR